MKVGKVCLIGDSGTGKRTWGNYISTTDEFGDKYLDITGAKITKLILEDSLKLMLWDITGKEQSSSLRNEFEKGAHGFLIFANAINQESIENINNYRKEIKKSAISTIVVTHVDNYLRRKNNSLDNLVKDIESVPENIPYFFTSVRWNRKYDPRQPISYLSQKILETFDN